MRPLRWPSIDNRTIRRANELIGIPWKRTVLALFLFGTAFGYLEAAVVSYLRELHEPARQRFHPGRSRADLFPLATLDQLRETGIEQTQTLAIEVGREAATIVMLAAIAFAVARNSGEWAAAFVITFGIWDITFYVFSQGAARLARFAVYLGHPIPGSSAVGRPRTGSGAGFRRDDRGGRVAPPRAGARKIDSHQRGGVERDPGWGGDHHHLVCDGLSEHHGGRHAGPVSLVAVFRQGWAPVC